MPRDSMHARVTPKRPNRRRRRRRLSRTRTPRLFPLTNPRENQNTHITCWFMIGRLPPTPPQNQKTERGREVAAAAVRRASFAPTSTVTVKSATRKRKSLAREVVNECTTSANVRRVVAHAIEGVTRALGGAALTARTRCQSLARYMCWSVMNTTLIFEN
jgi:hypothetical protein